MDTGSSTESTSVADIVSTSSREVRLPRWVDESFPDVHAILSGSEIAPLLSIAPADSTFKPPALAVLAAEGCLNSPFRGFR